MDRLMAFRIFVTAICCVTFGACNNDVTDNDNRLPDGKYPMVFTAAVDGLTQTRTTGKDSWTGNEEIAVSIDGGTSSMTYQITNASTGAMSPKDAGSTFYWQNSRQRILAWFPVSATDVNIKDQSSGDFSSYDYLVSDGIHDYNASGVKLSFKHVMAKVKVILKAGEGISDDDFLSAAIAVKGYTLASLAKGKLTGRYDGNEDDNWITPASADKEILVVPQQMQSKEFIKVTIDGIDYFYTPTKENDANLKGGNVYTYTITVKKTGLEVTTGVSASWDDTDLGESNATRLFEVALPSDHGQTLTVTGATQKDGSNVYTVNDNGQPFSISYTTTDDFADVKGFPVADGQCDVKRTYAANSSKTYTFTYSNLHSDLRLAYDKYIQVGDFYCKNASNEGYLIPADASLSDAQQKACIGIVFSTDVSRIGTKATEFLSSKGVTTPHGLVMALTDASSGCQWGNKGYDENINGNEGEPFKENIDYLNKQYADVDGYGETHWIINTYGSNATTLLNTYAAFYHANRYGTTDGGTSQYAPATHTTGWFIPSMGQWWDILSNLGGVNLDEYKNDTFKNGVLNIPGATTTIDNINKYLQKIKDAKSFSTPDVNFWSSSENNGTYACNMYSSNGLLCLHYRTKDFGQPYVRCIFAF